LLASLLEPADARVGRIRFAPIALKKSAVTETIADKPRFKAILEPVGHIALDCPLSDTGAYAYASGDNAAITQCHARSADFCEEGRRTRRLQQSQPNEIRRQPACRHSPHCIGGSVVFEVSRAKRADRWQFCAAPKRAAFAIGMPMSAPVVIA
jgi:hypothetical protein